MRHTKHPPRLDLLHLAQYKGQGSSLEVSWLESLGWIHDPRYVDTFAGWHHPNPDHFGLERREPPKYLWYIDSALYHEASVELQRRLLDRGWMCPWPDEAVGGQTFSAPGKWILAGHDLPWGRGHWRLGTKWTPKHGRSFVTKTGRITRGGQVTLKTAVLREGDQVRYLDWPQQVQR